MATPLKDLKGKKFGKWVVLERTSNLPNTRVVRFKCRCICGKVKPVISQKLLRGESTGCLECHLQTHIKHNLSKTKTYASWNAMINRCHRKNKHGEKYYKNRGITVCERWLDSFENFLADMGERPLGKTLDRINNDKNYEPENCRWATPKEQRKNQRPLIKYKLTMNDARNIRKLSKTLSHSALSKLYNVSSGCIWLVVNNKTWREEHETN